MSAVLMNAINTLNDKGLKYKVMPKGDNMALVFGIVIPDEKKEKLVKSKIEVFADADGMKVAIAGKDKPLDDKSLEAFVDTVQKLKAMQEEETKLIAELTE